VLESTAGPGWDSMVVLGIGESNVIVQDLKATDTVEMLSLFPICCWAGIGPWMV
jgi:hypothetical protein